MAAVDESRTSPLVLLSQEKVGAGDPEALQVRVTESPSSTVTDWGAAGDVIVAGAVGERKSRGGEGAPIYTPMIRVEMQKNTKYIA